MMVIHTADNRKWELFNEGVYYKVNHAYFWLENEKDIIKRNTWTGEEEKIAMADNLEEAKNFVKVFVEANLV